jgi:immune inhibitor A
LVIQADDLWELEKNVNGGWAGDLFPGPLNVKTFGSDTFPNSSAYYFWAGNDPKYGYSGVTASNITETAAGNITATLSYQPK